MQQSENGVFIERNVAPIFDADSDERYTNYWMAMKNFEGEVWGVIGIQVKMDAYDRLIPSPVIEEPY